MLSCRDNKEAVEAIGRPNDRNETLFPVNICSGREGKFSVERDQSDVTDFFTSRFAQIGGWLYKKQLGVFFPFVSISL
jgi:hypothetical protein